MDSRQEKAILVGLNITSKTFRSTEKDINEAMTELSNLAEAAGATVVARFIQNRPSKDVGYYVGKGKLEEVREQCLLLDAGMVIFNDELSGTQIRNIEEVLEVKVLDRTALILDIFAQRALSKEGKLQVELAQLRTLRKAVLPNKLEFLVVDTVGFVSQLPHNLIDAFKATLEEVKFADLIIHVVDISNDHFEMQMNTTLDVLKELGVENKPVITVYNKTDLLASGNDFKNKEDSLYISARNHVNLDQLLNLLEQKLMKDSYGVKIAIPFDKGEILYYLRNKYPVDKIEYKEESIEFTLRLNEQDFKKYH
ncbi:MAG: GTPase HflX [Peptococcaceae bacterium]|nr:GTPase HflX [Peptococcaceae bacterium]